jgi:hypothetical protein
VNSSPAAPESQPVPASNPAVASPSPEAEIPKPATQLQPHVQESVKAPAAAEKPKRKSKKDGAKTAPLDQEKEVPKEPAKEVPKADAKSGGLVYRTLKTRKLLRKNWFCCMISCARNCNKSSVPDGSPGQTRCSLITGCEKYGCRIAYERHANAYN